MEFPRDVLFCIFEQIKDPRTYQRCAMLDKICREPCGRLKDRKLTEFSRHIGEKDLLGLIQDMESREDIVDDMLSIHRLPNGTLHGPAILFTLGAFVLCEVIEATFYLGKLHGPYKLSTHPECSFYGTNGKEMGTMKYGLIDGEITSTYIENRSPPGTSYTKLQYVDGVFIKKSHYDKHGHFISETSEEVYPRQCVMEFIGENRLAIRLMVIANKY